MELISRLSYDSFFLDEPPELEVLLEKVPLEMTLVFLTQLMQKEKDFKSDKQEIEFIGVEWLQHCDKTLRQNIGKKFLDHIEIGSQERTVMIINTISTLRFIEFALHHQSLEVKNSDYQEMELRIFKAYLIFNQQENDFQSKLHFQINAANLVNEQTFFNYRLVVSTFEHQIMYYRHKKQLWSQLMKFFQFLEFVNTTEVPEIKNLVNHYLAENNIADWKDYFVSSMRMISAASQTGMVTFDSSKEVQNYKKILSRYFFKSETRIGYSRNDFLALRKFPLFQIEPNKVILLHLPFFMDKFFNSIFFDLNVYTKGYSPKVNFKSIYELNFGDHFLLPNSIRLLFKTKYKQIAGSKVEDRNLAFPDYYVRNGSKVYMFENKYIKLSDKVKTNYDIEAFKSEIYEKLFRTKNGKKKRSFTTSELHKEFDF